MFIPRSLAKKPAKPAVPSENPKLDLPTPLERAISQASSSNSKKRNIGDRTSSASSSDTGSDSDSNSDENDGSGSSDSDDKRNAPTVKEQTTTSSSSKPTSAQPMDSSEIAARFELALSDVSLWRTEPLYQRIAETSEWYIPFLRLHDHPILVPFFANPAINIPDAALVNALRTYGSGIFEFRMKIRAPSNAAWKGKSQTSSGWVGAAGGYEIRCKSWASRPESWMENLSATDERVWQSRMVYIERVPSVVRSIWAVYHFLTTLARLDSPNETETQQIIHDIFVPTSDPSLTQQQLEPPRRFRGQAFVVFATESLAHAFCKRWNWDASRETASAVNAAEKWTTESAKEAALSCSFRAMTKQVEADWDKRKAEYLAHQARILRQAPRQRRNPGEQTNPSSESQKPSTSTPPAPRPPTQHHSREPHQAPPFPPGILVFVRRLHPETNKTTLKTLFSRAFNGNGDAIEYLDFQKGIDSAHIRFRTPTDASTLSAYFASNLITQRDGLDDTGQPAPKASAIEAEVVLGTREANYWGKVPEKIRMAAVAKAGLGGQGQGGEKGRRKRQRKT